MSAITSVILEQTFDVFNLYTKMFMLSMDAIMVISKAPPHNPPLSFFAYVSALMDGVSLSH